MIIISDASPLIALGRIGKLDLLKEIFGSLILPDAVWKEVVKVRRDAKVERRDVERRGLLGEDYRGDWQRAVTGCVGEGRGSG